MDETPIWFDMPRNTTLAKTGTKNVDSNHSGYSKQKISVVLSVTASDQVLKTLVICMGIKKAPKKIHERESILVEGTLSGTMDAELMVEYAKKCIIPYTQNRPALLLLDRLRAHMTSEVVDFFYQNGVKCIFLPPSSISYLQPLDVSLNKPFKDVVRKKYDIWNDKNDHAVTKKNNRQRASYDEALSWIQSGIEYLYSNQNIIQESFQVTGLCFDRDPNKFSSRLKEVISHATKPMATNLQSIEINQFQDLEYLISSEEEIVSVFTKNQIQFDENNNDLILYGSLEDEIEQYFSETFFSNNAYLD
jgi:hypothetical protein